MGVPIIALFYVSHKLMFNTTYVRVYERQLIYGPNHFTTGAVFRGPCG